MNDQELVTRLRQWYLTHADEMDGSEKNQISDAIWVIESFQETR